MKECANMIEITERTLKHSFKLKDKALIYISS